MEFVLGKAQNVTVQKHPWEKFDTERNPALFTEIDKLLLKFVGHCKGSRIGKILLRRTHTFGFCYSKQDTVGPAKERCVGGGTEQSVRKETLPLRSVTFWQRYQDIQSGKEVDRGFWGNRIVPCQGWSRPLTLHRIQKFPQKAPTTHM